MNTVHLDFSNELALFDPALDSDAFNRFMMRPDPPEAMESQTKVCSPECERFIDEEMKYLVT